MNSSLRLSTDNMVSTLSISPSGHPPPACMWGVTTDTQCCQSSKGWFLMTSVKTAWEKTLKGLALYSLFRVLCWEERRLAIFLYFTFYFEPGITEKLQKQYRGFPQPLKAACPKLNILHSFATITITRKLTLIQYNELTVLSLIQDPTLHLVVMFPKSLPLCDSSLLFISHDLCTLEEYWAVILDCVCHFWFPNVLSRLGWRHAFLARIAQRWCCALLNASRQEVHDDDVSYYCDVYLDRLVKKVSASCFHYKVTVFPL